MLSKLRAPHDDDSDDDLEDEEGLKAEKTKLENMNKMRWQKLREYVKQKKWNVDNMCQVKEERTIVNTNAGKQEFTSSGYVAPSTGKKDSSADGGDPVKARKKRTGPKKTLRSQESVSELEFDSSYSSLNMKAMNLSESSLPETDKVEEGSEDETEEAGPKRDQVAMMSYHEFTEKYADLCEEFMKVESLSKCKDFLIQHGTVMLQENASNYLLLASLEDEMNGFRNKMRQTARQSQIISNIAELAKSMQTHPGNVIIPFFLRLEQKEFLEGFMEGTETFIGNIIKRAVVKKKEIDEERLKEEAVDLKDIPKEERLGPGGLDPVEVFESLPLAMQEAFESRDVEILKKALMEMEPNEAEEIMQRCVASGLWNDNKA